MTDMYMLHDRDRYGHDTETLTSMWRGVFGERFGDAFVDEHVQVRAEFKWVHAGSGTYNWLFWSVRIL